MSEETFMDMAKGLVCILGIEQVKEILLGDGWCEVEIYEFVEKCEG